MTVEVNPPMIAEVQKPYGPGNPHPLYGVDPNIMNECGHTHYPKWITVADKQVIAKDEAHEKELLGVKEAEGWGK